ncbi:MAG TPA: asparagine synthase (glutamine-hydrolyzing) [Blastocatellia bacterium]|nr:asparagine synthase (glutamine-hydrolyzing) [Blastocatellia bacterium]
MCGIVGMFGPEEAMTPERRLGVVAQMCQVIEHRGPDDDGFHIDGGLALGMRRLSIIDLFTGRQPISNEDDSIWIVFNGEIYNFKELRDDLISRGHVFQTGTDTEAIVHLYEDEGERCVERLRGMFAFAIWDKRERKLFIARDRVGVKPLHYCLAGETLIFASEIKSILQHPAVSREVNLEAISDFLTFGYVPDPASAFRGIFKLEPGHTLTFKDGRLTTRRYWDFNYHQNGEDGPPREETYYTQRIRELIAESVKLRLISDVPLGAFLSGGIDSSTVVAMMAREMNMPVKTFSIGFTESSFDELHYARITAKYFNTEHHEFIVTPDVCKIVEEIIWHHDEPFADVSSIPTYIVSKMAREHVTVILSGDGGDELFGGYDRYLVDRKREVFERIPSFLRRNFMLRASRAIPRATYGKNFLRNAALDPDARYVDSISYFDEELKRNLLSSWVRGSLNGRDSSAAFRRLLAEPRSPERLDHLLYLDSKTYLPGDILTKVDRMSMAHSIEAREPLLDHKLIEFVQSVPASLKLRGSVSKHVLKSAVRGLIPDEIVDRQKQGFGVPIRSWFNNELRELLYDTLTDSRTRQRGYFNQKAVEEILDEHRRRRRDNSTHLWGLLTLELWHRAFIDRVPDPNFEGAKRIELDRLRVDPAIVAEGCAR